ncbi:hypothetical protein FBY40_1895 [Microbacterium sp. SLBN-154]|uniref:hypothetical protein n=1 Tax=Microbacterium sp. SLBN-154 TaxID=2768458 RepID=UPI0011688047|nr:hypothetical protein [Microbacterium sp. SLBN-154]TQK19397.1 hypothetical protein FBY40_1895 [Microbacterium sp. SLBN-154]
MGVLWRFRRRRRAPYRAVTEEEQISRYVYLLNTLPASVIESAHAAAFRDLPLERRREMLAELRPFLRDDERRDAEAEPGLLAKLVRRAEQYRSDQADDRMTLETGDPRQAADPRSILMSAGVMTVVAQQFLLTQAVTAYFTVGAGSLMLAEQPGWLVDTVDPAAASVDAGAYGGDGGFGGGAFGDGGGFGGMDAGGFGGGFG